MSKWYFEDIFLCNLQKSSDKNDFQNITRDIITEMNGFLNLMKEVKDKGIINYSNMVKL